MIARQTPPIEGVSAFSLDTLLPPSLGFNGGRTFADFGLVDSFGQKRILRAYYDGHSRAWLTLWSGSCYRRIVMICNDGTRVRIVTRAGIENSTATLYMSDPADLYSISEFDDCEDFRLKRVSELRRVSEVVYRRETECMMRDSGSTYAHGRLGSELAYVVAKRILGLGQVKLVEPSKGGKDLYSLDGKTVIQARLLTKTKAVSVSRRRVQIHIALTNLIRKVRQDLEFNPSADTGYSILAYLDGSGETKILLARVDRDE
jgi:hypothetical protein